MIAGAQAATASERAAIEAVAFYDVFDFPPTLDEIWRRLPQALSREEVGDILVRPAVAGAVSRAESFYTLRGREHLAEVRRRRALASRRLWREARRYSALVARLPYVLMVAVTGSLAVDNAEAGDDIDLLIVTSRGRLWTARALTMPVVRAAGLRGVTLCPNYLLSEDALTLPRRDAYTAGELLQMVPLAGAGVYTRMLAANAWWRDILPNGSPAGFREVPLPRGGLGKWAERPLRARMGDRIEALLRRKAEELRRLAGDNPEAVFDERVCKGHMEGYAARTQSGLAQRLRALGLEER
jgi:hypothetical protein